MDALAVRDQRTFLFETATFHGGVIDGTTPAAANRRLELHAVAHRITNLALSMPTTTDNPTAWVAFFERAQHIIPLLQGALAKLADSAEKEGIEAIRPTLAEDIEDVKKIAADWEEMLKAQQDKIKSKDGEERACEV